MAEKNAVPEVKAAEVVTVGCKLPHGLWMEVQADGQPKTKILARGCNSTDIIGGFGITPNVPKDFWEAWLEQHKSLKFVRNGQIWAYKSTQGARDKAREMAELKHGMEGLSVDQLPSGIEPGKLE